jgi:hypothetical protein
MAAGLYVVWPPLRHASTSQLRSVASLSSSLSYLATPAFFSSPPPEGAGASAKQLLNRVLIRVRGRCGDQLRGGSNSPFRSLRSGPRLHESDGKAHWEPAQDTSFFLLWMHIPAHLCIVPEISKVKNSQKKWLQSGVGCNCSRRSLRRAIGRDSFFIRVRPPSRMSDAFGKSGFWANQRAQKARATRM